MKETKNSFFYITSFYRSLIAVFGSIFLIIFCVINLNKSIDDYPKVSGKIEKAHLYWNKSPYNIKLENIKDQWYSVYPKEYFPILKEKAVPGKIAEIWYNPKNNSIKKLVVDGEVLRPYFKSNWVNITFIVLGALFMIFNIIYIIRNPTHAKGAKGDVNI